MGAKMAPQRMLKLTLPCDQVAQAELRTCSGSAQVKAAAAHVQTLKQNQREKKLSMTLVVA
jgi:RNA polymerase-interacting CarD/CdnL/TRCF family regulator